MMRQKVIRCFFILFLFHLYLGCAGTATNQFQSKIEKMSDDELLSYYHGINDRIKDIDHEIKSREQTDVTEHDRIVSNQPFYLGGEGYTLVRKKNLVLKELRRRKLAPSP